ncbi:class I SAM-dependent methyltransferase [Bdellovibrionota bacterium FG-2]
MQVELEQVPCSLCGTDDFNVIYHSNDEKLKSLNLRPELYQCTAERTEFNFQLVECNRCKLTMINPRPAEKALFELAQTIEDEIYEDEKAGRLRTYKIALAELDKLAPPKPGMTYLDLSCYMGFFVETLMSMGRNAVGVDICSKVLEKGNARLKEKRLFAGDVKRWPEILENRKFDVVTSWDAIEHVSSPLSYLESARTMLNDDGLFVLTTMDYSSVFARLTGRKWPWLMPMHLYYFTPMTMQALLKKAGFEVIQRTTYTHVVSLGYLLYKLNGKFLGKFRDRGILKRVFLPVNFGDFMTVYARKTRMP